MTTRPMSAYQASLPEDQRPAYRDAIAKAARLLNEAFDDQAETALVYGPRAVAEAAYVPGGLSVEEIEAKYLRQSGYPSRDPASGRPVE